MMDRIYHTWDKWECYPAGFFDAKCRNGETTEEAEQTYKKLLSDKAMFSSALFSLLQEWPNSCEHNLSNKGMNRIAWLGQAALAYTYHIPARYRKGYYMLSNKGKIAADTTALKYLNKWLSSKNEPTVTLEEAGATSVANQY